MILPFKVLRRWLWRVALLLLALAVAFYTFACGTFLLLRHVDPPITSVQLQRSWENLFETDYHRQYRFVPLSQISVHLQNAVIAAEDGRFYDHSGFDWTEMRKAVDESLEEGRLGRGASTITQQLVKNLLLTTHSSLSRKAVEMTLTPLAEIFLPKERILELYLNVIEWGPGIFGIEEAAQTYYNVSASQLSREQSARLAACLPAPLHRRPQFMNRYSRQILQRMSSRGQ